MRSVALVLALGLAACGESTADAPPAQPALPEPFTAKEVARILCLSPLPPPPPDPTNRVADDPLAARLGQALFFEKRLSKDGDRSCATCHDPARGWSDGRSLSQGVMELNRHAPTLWNVAYQRWLFWDGRADSLWAQCLEPLESPLEQATTRLGLAHAIAGDTFLRELYEGVFGSLPPLGDAQRFPAQGRPVPKDEGHEHVLAPPPEDQPRSGLRPRRGHFHRPGQGFYHPHQRAWDRMSEEDQRAVTEVFVNAGKAIAAFERRLVSRRAPFDVFVEGLREHDERKLAALDMPARRGLALFVGQARCTLCHSGPNFSDLEFHDVGAPALAPDLPFDEGRLHAFEHLRENPFRGDGPWSDDPGGEAELKLATLPTHAHAGGELRTPTLRNVAVTAPYMHQGQFATLEEVLRFYSTRSGEREDPPLRETILEPLELSDEQVADLVAFLESLTDVEIEPSLTRPLEPAER